MRADRLVVHADLDVESIAQGPALPDLPTRSNPRSRTRVAGEDGRRGLLVAVLLLALASCASGENPDSRALPEADPDVSLREAMAEFRLGLPDGATDVSFGVFSGRETNLELKLVLDCASTDDVLTGGVRWTPHAESVPSLVSTVAHRNGWTIGPRTARSAESGDPFHGMYRAAVVTDLARARCQVVVAGFK